MCATSNQCEACLLVIGKADTCSRLPLNYLGFAYSMSWAHLSYSSGKDVASALSAGKDRSINKPFTLKIAQEVSEKAEDYAVRLKIRNIFAVRGLILSRV